MEKKGKSGGRLWEDDRPARCIQFINMKRGQIHRVLEENLRMWRMLIRDHSFECRVLHLSLTADTNFNPLLACLLFCNGKQENCLPSQNEGALAM
jgi:hypothetical protein